MRYLKEFWRIICFHYSLNRFVFDAVLLLIVCGVLNYYVFHQNATDQKETIIYSYIFFYSIKLIECLMEPKLLYWKVKKQIKNLLDQKSPNDWRIKSFEFDCKGMYSWDVEKINKLKVQNEKGITASV